VCRDILLSGPAALRWKAISGDHAYKFRIHDGDSIFSAEVDGTLNTFGLKVLRTPGECAEGQCLCERLTELSGGNAGIS
jgi:hypothetical protein